MINHCHECDQPAEPNRRRCIRHLEAARRYYKAYAQRNPDKVAHRKRKQAERRRDELKAKARRRYERYKQRVASGEIDPAPKKPMSPAQRAGQRRRRAKWMKTPVGVITNRLRCRLKAVLKDRSADKAAVTFDLVGCDINTLVAHVESQFSPGMSWDNRRSWHIDHIRPCASFDMTDPSQQRECFHFTNLRPVWAIENLRKGSSVVVY